MTTIDERPTEQAPAEVLVKVDQIFAISSPARWSRNTYGFSPEEGMKTVLADPEVQARLLLARSVGKEDNEFAMLWYDVLKQEIRDWFTSGRDRGYGWLLIQRFAEEARDRLLHEGKPAEGQYRIVLSLEKVADG